jgi:hypothetical protein
MAGDYLTVQPIFPVVGYQVGLASTHAVVLSEMARTRHIQPNATMHTGVQ